MVHLDFLRAESTGEDQDIFAMDDMSASLQQSSDDQLKAATPARLVVVLKRDHDLDAFKRIVRHLSRRGVDILKATLTRVDNFGGFSQLSGQFIILTFHLRFTRSDVEKDQEFSIRFRNEMKRLPHLDVDVLRWMDAHPEMKLQDAELVMALSRLGHCILAEERPLVFTLYHIEEFLTKHKEIVAALLRYFHVK
jgi:hypothetical protein